MIVRRLTKITSRISSSVPAAVKGRICVLDAIKNLIVSCYGPCNNFLLIWMNNAAGWDTFEVTSDINVDTVLEDGEEEGLLCVWRNNNTHQHHHKTKSRSWSYCRKWKNCFEM